MSSTSFEKSFEKALAATKPISFKMNAKVYAGFSQFERDALAGLTRKPYLPEIKKFFRAARKKFGAADYMLNANKLMAVSAGRTYAYSYDRDDWSELPYGLE